MDVSNPLAKLLFSDPLESVTDPSTFFSPSSAGEAACGNHASLATEHPHRTPLNQSGSVSSVKTLRGNSALRELAQYCRDRRLVGQSAESGQKDGGTSGLPPVESDVAHQRVPPTDKNSRSEDASAASFSVQRSSSHCLSSRRNRNGPNRKTHTTQAAIDEDWIPFPGVEEITSSSSASRPGAVVDKEASASWKRETSAWQWGDEEEPCTVRLSGMCRQPAERDEQAEGQEGKEVRAHSPSHPGKKTGVPVEHKLQPVLQPDPVPPSSFQSGCSLRKKRRSEGGDEEWDVENEEEDDDELRQKFEQEVLAAGGDFYDTSADEEDEKWVYKHLRVGDKKSDAILSCPGCFTPVCYQCQRHEKNFLQYRATAAYNVTVELEHPIPPRPERLRAPASNSRRRGRRESTTREKGTTPSEKEGAESPSGVCTPEVRGGPSEEGPETAGLRPSSSSHVHRGEQEGHDTEAPVDPAGEKMASGKADEGTVAQTDTVKERSQSSHLAGEQGRDADVAKSGAADTHAASGPNCPVGNPSEGRTSAPGETLSNTKEEISVLRYLSRIMESRKGGRLFDEDIKGTKGSSKQGGRRKQGKVEGKEEGEDEGGEEDEELFAEGLDGVVSYPLKCANCNTFVGLQDEKEVFHFFHVLPGEA